MSRSHTWVLRPPRAVDGRRGRRDAREVTVVPLPAHGRWARDVRGQGRAVRVSAHAEAGLVTVSVWRDGACVGTVRLAPG